MFTEVKSSHRRPVTVQKNDLFSSISVYSRFIIKDFSSSRFTECTTITIHRTSLRASSRGRGGASRLYRTVYQYIMIHGRQKRQITRISLRPPPPPSPMSETALTKIKSKQRVLCNAITSDLILSWNSYCLVSGFDMKITV